MCTAMGSSMICEHALMLGGVVNSYCCVLKMDVSFEALVTPPPPQLKPQQQQKDKWKAGPYPGGNSASAPPRGGQEHSDQANKA